ncbi:single-stranded DNA-binding protein [bacterium]|nr:single-stranded DNA-binding protein [bacterium]|tara:strand:+ start:4039 stop:4752 length:714 start_codon:yes stop_codon:yes gene_type:complete
MTGYSILKKVKIFSNNLNNLIFDRDLIVYNPIEYAVDSYSLYLKKYGNGQKDILFMGMNPGPWGMAQTGIPFGAIHPVKNFLKIETKIGKPALEHNKRPIDGFACSRQEVSGSRFWAWVEENWSNADNFFCNCFVHNYCPLAFFDTQGRNITPEKINLTERLALEELCGEFLLDLVMAMNCKWVIGIGNYAESKARKILKNRNVEIGKVLHPSPASPLANKGWSNLATQQMISYGLM